MRKYFLGQHLIHEFEHLSEHGTLYHFVTSFDENCLQNWVLELPMLCSFYSGFTVLSGQPAIGGNPGIRSLHYFNRFKQIKG